jgi:hypothetical protein
MNSIGRAQTAGSTSIVYGYLACTPPYQNPWQGNQFEPFSLIAAVAA